MGVPRRCRRHRAVTFEIILPRITCENRLLIGDQDGATKSLSIDLRHELDAVTIVVGPVTAVVASAVLLTEWSVPRAFHGAGSAILDVGSRLLEPGRACSRDVRSRAGTAVTRPW